MGEQQSTNTGEESAALAQAPGELDAGGGLIAAGWRGQFV